MRLDKFLKISLLFKTRSAGEKCIEQGNVMVNEKIAKPSTNVNIGDTISVQFPLKKVTYKINELHDKSVPRKIAREMATLIDEEHYEL